MTTTPGEVYDEDYFLHGQESGKSLYSDYRWLPELTIPMARIIAHHLGMRTNDCVLDFGCSRGYIVRALREIGFNAFGQDISTWAIEHADEKAAPYVNDSWIDNRTTHEDDGGFDWLIAKDVLEHIPTSELVAQLHIFRNSIRRGIFIVVPLAKDNPSVPATYVVPAYEADITHVQRRTMGEWLSLILGVFGHDWSVEASYRIRGIKDNYSQFEKGNGFITLRRL